MALIDIAPTLVAAGVKEADLTAIKEPVKVIPEIVEPVITKEVALKVVNECLEIEKNNGYLTIANKNGLSMDKVKAIHEEYKNYKVSIEKPIEDPKPIEEPIEIEKIV